MAPEHGGVDGKLDSGPSLVMMGQRILANDQQALWGNGKPRALGKADDFQVWWCRSDAEVGILAYQKRVARMPWLQARSNAVDLTYPRLPRANPKKGACSAFTTVELFPPSTPISAPIIIVSATI
jgi:hypothetical protein